MIIQRGKEEKMITPDSKKLYNKLDKSKINNVQIVRTPVAKVELTDDLADNQTLEVGGYKAIVHYNRQKEIDHSVRKMQKRFRLLRKKDKRARCCALGDSFPDTDVTDHSREGEPIR